MRARKNRHADGGHGLFLSLICLSFGSTGSAEEAMIEQEFEFDIPRQAVAAALTEFAEQADLTLVFPDDLVGEKSANALIGKYTLQEGADVLLAGTGLTPKFSNKIVLSISADEQSANEGEEMNVEKKGLMPFLASIFSVLPGLAFSQADSAEDVLEEIVVTAQFIEQSVQDTPISITAITGDMLDARGQNTLEEISAQVPNVTLTRAGSFAGPAFIGFIRGVGQTDFNPALEPGVGLYVDDVYYSTLTGSILDLLDLDRVEVLRGPQGTLAGKNSIGGAIKLYSQRPSAERNGYIDAGIGDYDTVDIRAASNFTLIDDELFARVSGVSRSRDGHVTTLDYGCTHPGSVFSSQITGSDCVTGTEGGIKYNAVRFALRWLPTDTLEINLSGDWVDDESEPVANTLLETGPTVAPVILTPGTGLAPTAPGPLIWENLAIPGMATGTVGCSFIAFGPNSCDPLSPNDPYVSYANYHDPRNGLVVDRRQYVESEGASLHIDWDLSDNVQVQSITGYREFDSGFASEQDGTPFPVTLLFQRIIHDQFSQEIRVNSRVGDFADITVGGFYFDANTSLDARVDLGYVGFDFIHGRDPVDTRNIAVFANGIFSLTDRLELTAGLRYSDDKKDYSYVRTNPDFSSIQPCLGPPGTPGNPPNCLISSLDGTSSTFQDERIDYRVALSYALTDSTLVYAQYSTGYKGGGVNPRPFYNVQAVSFQPEEMETVEIGAKLQLFENRLRLNGALFYNDYQGVTATFDNCTAQFGPILGVPCLLNSNAGDADVTGAELELNFAPTDALRIDASLGVLDFEYQNINPNTGIPLEAITQFTPELTWSIGAQYSIGTDSGAITPRLDAIYQDDLFTEPANGPASRIDSYTLLNGRITWEGTDGDWVLALEGRNLTDELYYINKGDGLAGGVGYANGYPGLPRHWLFSVRRNF
jgi:iron complex outermembrane receptor protein